MRTKIIDRSLSTAVLGLGFAFVAALPLQAQIVLDLTSAGNSGTINGAFFQQVPDQTTGTGVIKPFLRIQNNGTESGFNTSLGDPMPDVKKGSWTHDLLLSAVPLVTIGSTPYYQILLDINQTGANPLLSLDRLQVWLRNGAFTGAGGADQESDLTGGTAVKVWDLDGIGAANNNRIELNYALNPGSGAGDMFAYIPKSLVNPLNDQGASFYLFADFGVPNGTNDGFEEFAIIRTDGSNDGETPGVPDGGSTVALFGFALMVLGMIRPRIRA